MLLGAEYNHQILIPRKLQLNSNSPIFQNTLLGWVPAGKFNSSTLRGVGLVDSEDSIENVSKYLEKFRKLEEPEDADIVAMSISDQLCENHFARHTTRNKNGQFIVSIPWKDNPLHCIPLFLPIQGLKLSM